jgi:hypothetical protein
MNFNKHSEIVGQHAFLGASKYHWLNYDEDKLVQAYLSSLAVQKGTELHDLACRLITLGVKLPKSKSTLNLYVNDAIAYRLTPEQPLYFSRNCFGTADAIAFNEKDRFLRIHDLKTGVTPAHMEQLEIYAALFCLEYHKQPQDLGMELRIYQNNEILVHTPQSEAIDAIMRLIIRFDGKIEKLRTEE